MSIYEKLNPVQQEAVYQTSGPVLILAGAGSGKTRVLTHRIAYLIDVENVNPWNILAITFTNKAAGEMRERVDQIVGYGSENVWVSTFHSTCVRILRRYIDKIGYDRNFTIYDSDDQKSVVKDICKRLNIDTKIYKERALMSVISSAKDELTSPDELLMKSSGDYAKAKAAQVYKEYQKVLKNNNALDFDDLIMKTVELFRTQPDVLEYYQERFKYIMVDEYQDTNTAQFKFVSILASKYQNLCVVGDDDQSIYKFRGANIYNILNFEHEYPNARVIKLEQNYRSTQNILNAANEVIRNNSGRKSKTLWTSNDEGDKVAFEQYNTEYEEAAGIVDDIDTLTRKGNLKYSDCAVLYRTNAQSRILEEKFVYRGIPYRIIGGQNFYARKEIKDLLCYLKTIDNGSDDLAVRRIINVPKRGIGVTTLNKVSDYAESCGISLFEALVNAHSIPTLGKAADKIAGFTNMIQVLRAKLEYIPLAQLMQEIIDETGYVKELEAESTEEAMGRIENIDELMNKIIAYEEEHDEPNLSEFLEEVSLVADIDNLDESNERVVLMTLHSAKGLEFPYVYMTGMEDGMFPSYMSIVSDDNLDIEEERRLCYVGITRAMEHLTLTYAKSRMVRGMTQYNKISRFVKEIPRNLIDMNGVMEREKPEEKFVTFSGNLKPYGGVYTTQQQAQKKTDESMRLTGNTGAKLSANADQAGITKMTTGADSYRSTNTAGFGKNGSAAGAEKSGTSGRSKLDELLKSQKIFKGSDIFDKKTAGAQASVNAGTSAGANAVGNSGSSNKAANFGAYGGSSGAGRKTSAASSPYLGLDYMEGDRVRHIKFGEGTVVNINDNGQDYEVTVNFDSAGVKRMRASFAKLKCV